MVVGVNDPWFCTQSGVGMSRTQFDELLPRLVRDPGMKQAQWDHAASKGVFMMPLLESPNITALSWAAKHPAFSGVVELSNEPFWNSISASSWVKTWGPVIDQIDALYPSVQLLAPIDDWPTAHTSGPGTSAWTQQLFAARPSLRQEIDGWAIHPYFDGGPAQALQHLQNGINALKANGVPNPRMFCTEMGWSRQNTSEGNQAAFAQSFLTGAALKPEVAAVLWYQDNDTERPTDAGWNRDAGFGLYKEPASGNWSDTWTKAQVWSVWKKAITASPTGDFRAQTTQTATVTVSLDGTSKPVPITVTSTALAAVRAVQAVNATGGTQMKLHPKVKAGAGVGGVGALVAWIVGQYGVPVPPEVAVAVNTIVAFVASYLTSSTPTP